MIRPWCWPTWRPMKQFLAVKGRFPPKQQPKEAAPKDADSSEETGQTRGPVVPRLRGRAAPAEIPSADAEARHRLHPGPI